jgi:hypothetical protein
MFWRLCSGGYVLAAMFWPLRFVAALEVALVARFIAELVAAFAAFCCSSRLPFKRTGGANGSLM